MAHYDHVPVLVRETLHFLVPERAGWYVDCTVGLGGHATALLEASPGTKVLGIDRDPQALAQAATRLARFGDRVRLVPGRFAQVASLVAAADIGAPVGLLADIGVSSLQLDAPERGFALSHDGPLDMRMTAEDTESDHHYDTTSRTAADIINTESEAELTRIFREYGEERHARRIARAVVNDRVERPFETTAELRSLIERVKPARPDRNRRIHPATLAFQGLRIEVNGELDELSDLMSTASDLLDQDGRMVIISYHSLEDRIVKHTLRDLATGEIDRVTGRPRAETQVIEVLTRKPVRPSEDEVVANPRSRSARLRAGRRL